MSHHLIPDSALDWWARGFTAREIRGILHERTGKRYSVDGIQGAIIWARKQGDMRAARRNEKREGA
jgi:hypothetical protein